MKDLFYERKTDVETLQYPHSLSIPFTRDVILTSPPWRG